MVKRLSIVSSGLTLLMAGCAAGGATDDTTRHLRAGRRQQPGGHRRDGHHDRHDRSHGHLLPTAGHEPADLRDLPLGRSGLDVDLAGSHQVVHHQPRPGAAVQPRRPRRASRRGSLDLFLSLDQLRAQYARTRRHAVHPDQPGDQRVQRDGGERSLGLLHHDLLPQLPPSDLGRQRGVDVERDQHRRARARSSRRSRGWWSAPPTCTSSVSRRPCRPTRSPPRSPSSSALFFAQTIDNDAGRLDADGATGRAHQPDGPAVPHRDQRHPGERPLRPAVLAERVQHLRRLGGLQPGPSPRPRPPLRLQLERPGHEQPPRSRRRGAGVDLPRAGDLQQSPVQHHGRPGAERRPGTDHGPGDLQHLPQRPQRGRTLRGPDVRRRDRRRAELQPRPPAGHGTEQDDGRDPHRLRPRPRGGVAPLGGHRRVPRAAAPWTRGAGALLPRRASEDHRRARSTTSTGASRSVSAATRSRTWWRSCARSDDDAAHVEPPLPSRRGLPPPGSGLGDST